MFIQPLRKKESPPPPHYPLLGQWQSIQTLILWKSASQKLYYSILSFVFFSFFLIAHLSKKKKKEKERQNSDPNHNGNKIYFLFMRMFLLKRKISSRPSPQCSPPCWTPRQAVGRLGTHFAQPISHKINKSPSVWLGPP